MMAEIANPKKTPPGRSAMRPPEAEDLVRARLYSSEEEVIRDALRHLLRARPDARVQKVAEALHRVSTASPGQA
jgi:hypothetical protein